MNKKTVLVIGAIVLTLSAAVAAMWTIDKKEELARASRPAAATIPEKKPVVQPTQKPRGPVPAFQIQPTAANLGPTLDPELFTGSARTAYQIAKEIPETLAEVPCYCHCDRGFGHKSLHSCFMDDHGANCSMCINEAIAAYKMKKETDLSGWEIREKIIEQFGK